LIEEPAPPVEAIMLQHVLNQIRQIEREDFILGNRSIGFEEPCRHPYPEGCKRKREQVSDKKTK